MKLSKTDIHAKHPVPTNQYYLTITQGYLDPRKEDPVLVLCHTIDTGVFAYQHVLVRFNLTTGSGKARLKKMSDGIEFDWFVQDVYDPLFPEQFVALRTKASVQQSHDSYRKIIYNDIIEWFVADKDPQYNVMKDKDTEIFKSSKRKGKPKLPV